MKTINFFCDISQQILKIVDRNFKSFFALLKLKAQGKKILVKL